MTRTQIALTVLAAVVVSYALAELLTRTYLGRRR